MCSIHTFHKVEVLEKRTTAGLQLFECVACAGEVRCARSLFAAYRSLQGKARAASAVPVGPAPRSNEPSFSGLCTQSYGCDLPSYPELTKLGDALHICCGLGHVELLDYLLLQLAGSTAAHLERRPSRVQRSVRLLFLQLPDITPIECAIVCDQAPLVAHLLPRIRTQLPFSLPYEGAESHTKNFYYLKLNRRFLSECLTLCARYGSHECARLLVNYINEEHQPRFDELFPDDSKRFFMWAAYQGPRMLALFDSFLLPQQTDNFWDGEPSHFVGQIPIRADTMRTNFEYLQQIMVASRERDSTSGLVRPEQVCNAGEQQFLKAAKIVTAWLHTYCYAFCEHGEANSWIIPATMNIVQWKVQHGDLSARNECVHVSADSAASSSASHSRAEHLALLDELLAFERARSDWSVLIAFPSGELVACPAVHFLVAVRFRDLLSREPWRELLWMSTTNHSHPFTCLLELFLGHVAALSSPVQAVIYQIIYGQIQPSCKTKQGWFPLPFEKQLAIVMEEHMDCCNLRNLTPTLLSYWMLWVHYYARAIKLVPSIQFENLQSATKERNFEFTISPAPEAIQLVSYFLYCTKSTIDGNIFKHHDSELGWSATLNIVQQVIDAACPIRHTSSANAECFVERCLIPAFAYMPAQEFARYDFTARVYRHVLFACTLPTAHLLVQAFAGHLRKRLHYRGLSFTTFASRFPTPLGMPSLSCWIHINQALARIALQAAKQLLSKEMAVHVPKQLLSLREIARNGVWIGLLSCDRGPAEGEHPLCMRDRVDQLGLPALIKSTILTL